MNSRRFNAPLADDAQSSAQSFEGLGGWLKQLWGKPEELFDVDSQRLAQKTKLLSVDEDLRRQLNLVDSLQSVWQFLLRRLTTGAAPKLVLFSVVDQPAELVKLRFVYPAHLQDMLQGEFVPLCDQQNHLVRTIERKDTTFTASAADLGQECHVVFEQVPQAQYFFSIPFIAAGKSIAVLTLGFDELDAFSQAKLSSVYLLRDAIAQVVYNLILQEQLLLHPPLDSLLQIPTAQRFDALLSREWRRHQLEGDPVSVMLIDFVQLRAYNAQHSAQLGDQALLRLASVIKRHITGADVLLRMRSDQLAVIMVNDTAYMAEQKAQKIMADVSLPYRGLPAFNIAVGVAQAVVDANTPDQLKTQVLNALQLAKINTHQSQPIASQLVQASQLPQATTQQRLQVLEQHLADQLQDLEGSVLFEVLMASVNSGTPLTASSQAILQHPGVALLAVPLSQMLLASIEKMPLGQSHLLHAVGYATAIATAMQLTAGEVERIRLAALLQNIGYNALPEGLLSKLLPLTVEEQQQVYQHPKLAVDHVLAQFPALSDILPLIEFHHEAVDGSGYPIGLKGENIPLGARIIAVADAFAAMTANRPYRGALAMHEALDILRLGAGRQWDTSVVEKLAQLVMLAEIDMTESAEADNDFVESLMIEPEAGLNQVESA